MASSANYSAITSEPSDMDHRPASAASSRSGRHAPKRLLRKTDLTNLDFSTPPRRKKEVGVVGNASWISSVINLVNTSRSPEG